MIQQRRNGNPVSIGIGIGKAVLCQKAEYEVRQDHVEVGQEAKQKENYEMAVHQAQLELNQLIETLRMESPEKAQIFEAHREILEDEEVQEEIMKAILTQHQMADYAVSSCYDDYIKLIAQSKNPLIAERTIDFVDVKNRLIRILQGRPEISMTNVNEPVILVAKELLPSDTAVIDCSHVMGIVIQTGGTTSHSAIIARSYRIPAVLGVEDIMESVKDGQLLIVDGENGEVIIEPDDICVNEKMEKAERLKEQQRQESIYLNQPARLADGSVIKVGINIGKEQFSSTEAYYDEIGLFRTEFLYMEKQYLPTEEEQFQAYCNVLRNAKGKKVTLRTLDIGGDKTLPYLSLPKEQNPFLGNRALRYCFTMEELFRTQLRAALRAAKYGNLQLMFPMVGSLDDIHRVKAILQSVKQDLKEKKMEFEEQIPIGIMIEIPSIALMADVVAREVDFASIGTNDLTQYLCAADRMNPAVSEYYQSFSPALFRLLGFLVEQFHSQKKPLSICGELAGNAKAAVILAGLGFEKLSMSESNLAAVKASLAKVTLEQAKRMAQECCHMSTQSEVLANVQSW